MRARIPKRCAWTELGIERDPRASDRERAVNANARVDLTQRGRAHLRDGDDAAFLGVAALDRPDDRPHAGASWLLERGRERESAGRCSDRCEHHHPSARSRLDLGGGHEQQRSERERRQRDALSAGPDEPAHDQPSHERACDESQHREARLKRRTVSDSPVSRTIAPPIGVPDGVWRRKPS